MLFKNSALWRHQLVKHLSDDQSSLFVRVAEDGVHVGVGACAISISPQFHSSEKALFLQEGGTNKKQERLSSALLRWKFNQNNVHGLPILGRP